MFMALCASTELPDPVKNCTAFNITSSSLQVQCLAGKNGGIPQQFHVEVVEQQSRELLVNVSFKMPEFLLKRLPSDTDIVIKVSCGLSPSDPAHHQLCIFISLAMWFLVPLQVLSYNLQGSSSWYRLKTRTLPAPLLKTGK